MVTINFKKKMKKKMKKIQNKKIMDKKLANKTKLLRKQLEVNVFQDFNS